MYANVYPAKWNKNHYTRKPIFVASEKETQDRHGGCDIRRMIGRKTVAAPLADQQARILKLVGGTYSFYGRFYDTVAHRIGGSNGQDKQKGGKAGSFVSEYEHTQPDYQDRQRPEPLIGYDGHQPIEDRIGDSNIQKVE